MLRLGRRKFCICVILMLSVSLVISGQNASTKSNPYPAGQCTAWVWSQVDTLFGIPLPEHLDSGDWYDEFPQHTRVIQSQTPRGRAIAVWRGEKGPECVNKDSNPNAPIKCFGHVAYIKSVDSQGNAELTEANNPVGNPGRTVSLGASQIPNHLRTHQFAGYLYLPRPELLFKGRTEVSQAGQMTVTGTHFIHNSNVRIYYVYNNIQGDLLATIQSDNNGSFSWAYAPGCDNPGIHEFRAVDEDNVESNVVVTQVDGSLKCIFAPNVAHAAGTPNSGSQVPQPSQIGVSPNNVASQVSDGAPALQNQPQDAAPTQPLANSAGSPSSQQTLSDQSAPAVPNQPQYQAPTQPSTSNPDEDPSTQQTLPAATAPAVQYQAQKELPVQSFVNPDGSSSAQQTLPDSATPPVQNQPQSTSPAQPSVASPNGTPSGQQTIQTSGPIAGAPAATLILSRINPASHSMGQFTVDIYGSGFQQGAKIFAQGQGWSSNQPPVTVIDSAHLQAVIDTKIAGSFTLAVRNPDGSLSSSLPIQITAAAVPTANVTSSSTAPILQSVSPMTHAAGQFQVDLYGSGFQQGAKVVAQGTDWNSDQAAVMYLAPNHLRAIIAATNPSRFTLTVRNPDGQLSGPQPFEVTLVPATTPGKPVQSNQRPGASQAPTPNHPATPADSHTGSAPQPNTGQPSATGIASPLSKASGQPVGSLPNSGTNAGNPRTSSTTVPNRPPGTSQSSVPVQKALPSQEPMRPIQVQTVPGSHPGSTISTTTTVVPKINVPSKTSPTTQTNPVVQQTTNNSDTQKSTNRQVKTTVPTSYPSSTAATGQNTVSKPVIQPGTLSSSTTSSTVHTTTSPTAHTPPTANSAVTNQKPVPMTNTPPRGVATTTTSTSTQQRSQPPSNQKSSSPPAPNTNQRTTQKPGDKKN